MDFIPSIGTRSLPVKNAENVDKWLTSGYCLVLKSDINCDIVDRKRSLKNRFSERTYVATCPSQCDYSLLHNGCKSDVITENTTKKRNNSEPCKRRCSIQT